MASHAVEQITSPTNDTEQVRRALARDASAFRVIMQTHNRCLYRIARSILRNNADAEDVVEQATDNLPEAFRLVFVARVIEGMSIEETSELLGIKPETVKTRLHRARQLVRDQLEKEIGPVLTDAFPFAGRRCERMTETVMKRLGFSAD